MDSLKSSDQRFARCLAIDIEVCNAFCLNIKMRPMHKNTPIILLKTNKKEKSSRWILHKVQCAPWEPELLEGQSIAHIRHILNQSCKMKLRHESDFSTSHCQKSKLLGTWFYDKPSKITWKYQLMYTS